MYREAMEGDVWIMPSASNRMQKRADGKVLDVELVRTITVYNSVIFLLQFINLIILQHRKVGGTTRTNDPKLVNFCYTVGRLSFDEWYDITQKYSLKQVRLTFLITLY